MVDAKLVRHGHIMVIRHFHCHPVMAADRLQPPDLIVVLKCNAVHLVCTILLQQTAQSFDTFPGTFNIRKNNINKVLLADSARNLFFSVFRRLINNKRISTQHTRIRCDCLGRSHTDLRCIYAACRPDTLAFFCVWHCSVPHRIVRKLNGQMRNLGFIGSRLLLRVNHYKFFRCIMACTGIVVSRDHGGTVIRCFLSN